MNDSDFNDCCNFIKSRLPETQWNFDYPVKNLNEIINILQKLIDERIISLTESGIHHDDWPDDLELADIEAYYSMIKREIYHKNKK